MKVLITLANALHSILLSLGKAVTHITYMTGKCPSVSYLYQKVRCKTKE
jgi:hypothetical protein